ncbi:4'-phosphopantetheinyl transferase family protein [Galactobacter caseinivorans]|uniref:Phosphopantetheinyl transferase n=1 Tax=Galactobacter caseinivorans TaxID=2676123 RepID=A0A496PJZ1_9MICC|nr:hypothetical protein [Galactobacter caseinivorans]RKW70833.1 hypothetical protein DWQ67_07005 [Galactobacter caseinivorans]
MKDSLPDGVRWACAPLAGWAQRATGAPESWGLSADETARAAAFTSDAARIRFVAGRLAAREVAAGWLGLIPQNVSVLSECPRCGVSGHGRPTLHRLTPDGEVGEALAQLSLSRAGGHVLLAMAPLGVSLGADLVELSDPAFDSSDPGYVGRAAIWALAEARGKAAGTGIVSGEPPAQPHEWVGEAAPGMLVAVVARKNSPCLTTSQTFPGEAGVGQ